MGRDSESSLPPAEPSDVIERCRKVTSAAEAALILAKHYGTAEAVPLSKTI
jgi:hypothetical protein